MILDALFVHWCTDPDSSSWDLVSMDGLPESKEH